MANYYSQFSTLIPCRTQEEFDWLIKALSPIDVNSLQEGEEYDDELENAACEFKREDKGLWIYSEEGFQIERTMYALAEFQTKFSITDTWTVEWAFMCSKPVLDSFSGGGCIIKDGEAHFCDVSNKLAEMKAELDAPKDNLNEARKLALKDGFVGFFWGVDDVLELRPDLNKEQALEVLERLEHKWDASIGVNWDTIEFWADDMFPKTD